MNRFAFRCGHFQRQQWEYYVIASWVPYHINDHSPFSTPHNDLTRPPIVATAKNDMHPSCLAHVVSGVFCSVLANRRQPKLYIYTTANTTMDDGVSCICDFIGLRVCAAARAPSICCIFLCVAVQYGRSQIRNLAY